MGNILACCSQTDKVIDYTDSQPETRRTPIGSAIYTRQSRIKKQNEVGAAAFGMAMKELRCTFGITTTQQQQSPRSKHSSRSSSFSDFVRLNSEGSSHKESEDECDSVDFYSDMGSNMIPQIQSSSRNSVNNIR